MALKTGEEYVASIKALELEANVLGKRTGDLTEHALSICCWPTLAS